MRALVTGASGFIGSYLVDELIAGGHEVSALCLSGVNTAPLRKRGVKIITGDVTDAISLRESFRGQNWIFHLVAIVRSYGTWQEFQRVGIDGTRNVADAAAACGVDRFVHISSISVYGLRPQTVYAEDTPFDETPEPWNHYVKQKVSAEKILWGAHKEGKINLTVLRPSIALGPRDRNGVRRALNILKSPVSVVIGSGRNRIPCVVVEELAPTIVRAASTTAAAGKVYNVSGRDPITQVEYLKFHANAAGLRPPKLRVNKRVLMGACALLESVYRLARREEEPFCTRFAVASGGNDYEIDCSRATAELGWEGSADYEDAIQRSVTWYLKHQKG